MKHTILIDVEEWDDLVKTTYNRPYSFQQQDGCKECGTEFLTVPVNCPEDYDNATIAEDADGDEQGVSFSAWLSRDPSQPLATSTEVWDIQLWWGRNFYPNVEVLANDLHTKGLLPAGEYAINIGW